MSGVTSGLLSSFGEFVNAALAFDFVNPPQLVSAGFNGSSQYLTVPASANYALELVTLPLNGGNIRPVLVVSGPFLEYSQLVPPQLHQLQSA